MYEIVFTGELLSGVPRKRVEARLARYFKATQRQVEWFLRGVPIVAKTTPDRELAQRYFDALTECGLVCELREISAPSSTAPAVPEERVGTPPPSPPVVPTEAASPVVSAAPPEDSPAAVDDCYTVPVFSRRSVPAAGARDSDHPGERFGANRRAFADALVTGAGSIWRRRREFAAIAVLCVGGMLAWLKATAPEKTESAYRTIELESAPEDITPFETAPVAEAAPAMAEAVPPVDEAEYSSLIIGHWICVNAQTGRVSESLFAATGEYRAVQFGDPAAAMLVDTIDLELAGSYALEGRHVLVHITEIPARLQFGAPGRTSEMSRGEIRAMRGHMMAWRLEDGRGQENCMRADLALR